MFLSVTRSVRIPHWRRRIYLWKKSTLLSTEDGKWIELEWRELIEIWSTLFHDNYTLLYFAWHTMPLVWNGNLRYTNKDRNNTWSGDVWDVCSLGGSSTLSSRCLAVPASVTFRSISTTYGYKKSLLHFSYLSQCGVRYLLYISLMSPWSLC